MSAENNFEIMGEHIPTRQEVWEIISESAKDPIFVRELIDGKGLYLLEARIEGDTPGNYFQYEYMRKGRHSNQNQISVTNIYFMSYEDGVVVGGIEVAVYDEEVGRWKGV